MVKVCTLALACLLACDAFAQADPDAALEWALALGGRFRELHNPVAGTYALASLATLVCTRDKGKGSELFHDSLSRLDSLGLASFNENGPVLPVSSYSGLWKFVLPAALKCDLDLAQFAAGDAAKAKMDEERRQANKKLQTAIGIVESNPDRAAQLADAALPASVPLELDIALPT